jgi:hypothetical protein
MVESDGFMRCPSSHSWAEPRLGRGVIYGPQHHMIDSRNASSKFQRALHVLYPSTADREGRLSII